MSELIEFQPYLSAIAVTYEQWWERYTLTDAQGKSRSKSSAPFDFGLMVQTVNEERREEEKIERFPVLDGIRKYAEQHVLLVGRPGSGKSTALARLLLEEATASTRVPILVELRYWQGSIEQLILDSLRRHGLAIANLDPVLSQALILFDGVNELPSDEARSQLSAFRRNHPRVPMIFTTRDLSIGGDLGIEKRLEMQPLTEKQMELFIRSYVPEQAEAMLRQLKGRLREFGQTPLLLWMLCGVFQQTGRIPENLGLVFREFTQGYERYLKDDVRIESDRAWWKPVLQQLAWVMMQGEKPTEFRVAIRYEEAVRAIAQFLDGKVPYAEDFARKCLRDLQNHHLIQPGVNRNELEFRHQLIQEYYAAEALLTWLEKAGLEDGEQFKREFLNFLKWTEPMALMLALMKGAQTERIVNLAIKVDLMLGARLVGEVTPGFQASAITELANVALEKPLWLRLELLQQTNSKVAASHLIPLLDNLSRRIRAEAYLTLLIIAPEAIPKQCKAREDSKRIRQMTERLETNESAMLEPQTVKALVPSEILRAMKDADVGVCLEAVRASANIDSEEIAAGLLEVIYHSDLQIRRLAADNLRILSAKENIAEFLNKFHLQNLVEGLDNSDEWVCWRITFTLWNVASEEVVPLLFQARLNHTNSKSRLNVALVLGKFGYQEAVPALVQMMDCSNLNKCLDDADEISYIAAYALGRVQGDVAAKYLPRLLTLLSTQLGKNVLYAISAIQQNCKYYSYEIYQTYLEAQKADRQTPPNSDRSIVYNIDRIGNLNTGNITIQGDQIGEQP